PRQGSPPREATGLGDLANLAIELLVPHEETRLPGAAREGDVPREEPSPLRQRDGEEPPVRSIAEVDGIVAEGPEPAGPATQHDVGNEPRLVHRGPSERGAVAAPTSPLYPSAARCSSRSPTDSIVSSTAAGSPACQRPPRCASGSRCFARSPSRR